MYKSRNIDIKESDFTTVAKSNCGYMLNAIQNNLNPKNCIDGNRAKDFKHFTTVI